MIETITRRDLPDEFAGTYETDGAWNSIENRFIEEGSAATRWVARNEFEFGGFMRIAAFLHAAGLLASFVEVHARLQDFAESEAAEPATDPAGKL